MRRTAKPPVDIHWGLPTRRCECEHTDHFPSLGGECEPPQGMILGHSYGADFPRKHIHPVSTSYGTFHVCPACAQTCLAKVEV